MSRRGVEKPTDNTGPDDKVGPFFQHDYILVVPVDTQVGTIARGLMRGGHRLKPLDAVHAATALVANVDEFHTFDDRLLSLDGKLIKLDGTALKICKPAHGGGSMPLFDTKLSEVATDSPKPEAPDKAAHRPKLDTVEPKGPDQEVPPAGGAACSGTRIRRSGPDDETAGGVPAKAPQNLILADSGEPSYAGLADILPK